MTTSKSPRDVLLVAYEIGIVCDCARHIVWRADRFNAATDYATQHLS